MAALSFLLVNFCDLSSLEDLVALSFLLADFVVNFSFFFEPALDPLSRPNLDVSVFFFDEPASAPLSRLNADVSVFFFDEPASAPLSSIKPEADLSPLETLKPFDSLPLFNENFFFLSAII